MLNSSLPRLAKPYGCAPCMEKLNRLEWTSGITFTSHGARIGIRVNDPAVLNQIPAYLPPGWRESSVPVDTLYSLYVGGESGHGRRVYNLLYAGTAQVARTMDLDEVFRKLEDLLHFNVAVRARHKLFVHAGAVGWRGRAIIIPGRSMSGKTTLVAELVRAGATYYSDEFAVFDRQGRVHPYARPLMVREGPDARQQRYPVEVLGGRAGREPLPVGLIVLTEYKEGARWRPRRLSRGQGLLALMENTVLARVRPEEALRTLQPVALHAAALKSRRGDARELAYRLLEEVAKGTTVLSGNRPGERIHYNMIAG